MANTTDIMITSFFDEEAIREINNKTGLDLLKVSDGSNCGGPKCLSFESYGACHRSIGIKRIDELINVFKSADFKSPEYAVLIIDDDDDCFNGVITL